MKYQAELALLLAIVYRSSIMAVEPDKIIISEMLGDIVINGSVSGNPESDRVEAIKLLINEKYPIAHWGKNGKDYNNYKIEFNLKIIKNPREK